MTAFPTTVAPSYDGFSKTSSPNIRVISFADGYEQRIMTGLSSHQNPKTFKFQWKLTEAQADEIEDFLDARAENQESFDYQPAGESSSLRFVCDSWSKNIPFNNFAIISATFRQVFDATSLA